MKKTILIIAIMAAMTSLISAQNDGDYREKISFGFKIGGNLSNVYDSEGEEFRADAKLGFAGGAFLEIPIGAFIGVHPEILFSQKGFRATGSLLGLEYTFTRTTNYIDVPLYFAIKPIEYVTILVGPQYSYLLKQNDEFESNLINHDQQYEFENEDIRKNLLSFSAGIDVNIDHIVVGLRAGYDLLKNNGDGSTSTPRYKNAWYQATLGYRF